MNHYADDAFVELAGVPIISGKDAIRKLHAQGIVEVSKGGDMAYARGAYTATRTDAASKRPVTAKGKYVVVYRKESDGHWKAIQDINHRDS
jgi:ketosteroid isomerase-like protein